MIGENRQLVTDEPAEVQEFKRITDHFKGIYRLYRNLITKIEGGQHATGWTCKH
jgi:hypothetical protein